MSNFSHIPTLVPMDRIITMDGLQVHCIRSAKEIAQQDLQYLMACHGNKIRVADLALNQSQTLASPMFRFLSMICGFVWGKIFNPEKDPINVFLKKPTLQPLSLNARPYIMFTQFFSWKNLPKIGRHQPTSHPVG